MVVAAADSMDERNASALYGGTLRKHSGVGYGCGDGVDNGNSGRVRLQIVVQRIS
jgi:hypothetical protein